MKAIVSPQNLHRSKQRKAVLKNGKNATKKVLIGVWLSLVERLLREQEVASSNLVTPTIFGAICTKNQSISQDLD